MNPSDDRLARVALNRLGEPGDLRLSSLVEELGAQALYQHLLDERDHDGLLTDVAARLGGLDPERELAKAARQGLRFVVPGDEEWPVRLDDLAGAGALNDRGGVPVGLWVTGPLRLDRLGDAVAVVGARDCSTYGSSVAAQIAEELASAGRIVVSGAAIGIDAAAHRGAISVDGPSLAVLACGADRVYPVVNAPLLRHLAQTGAVVSEAAPGCSPQRIRFLARNRLIAALTRATVVVEAETRSGALNTANWADRLHRGVLGVPGPVTSSLSAGVHQGLRSGSMSLVAGGADVLEATSASGEHLVDPAPRRTEVRDRLTARQRQVLDAVPVGTAADAHSIARVAGMGLLEVRSALGKLRTHQLVELLPTGWRLGEAMRG